MLWTLTNRGGGMSRGQGRVFRPTYRDAGGVLRHADTWWLDYTVGGKRHREPTKAATTKEAQDELRKRIGDRQAGKIVGRPDRVTLKQLHELVERQYALDGRKSVARVKEAFAHLEGFFGEEERVTNITRGRIDAYAAHRLAAGRARATVNNELAQLRRGFRLAIETGLLATMPVFRLPKAQNARQGFFTEGEFAAVLLELSADVRDLGQ